MWNAWLDTQFNEPSRADFYIMRATAEIVSMLSGKQVDPNQFRITVHRKSPNQSSPRNNLWEGKARWFGMVGMPPQQAKAILEKADVF